MRPKNLIFTVYLTGLLITAPACIDEVAPDNIQSSEKYSLSTENLVFHADGEKYRQANTGRAKQEYCQLDFDIQRVQRSENELTIHITKPIGCRVNYEIVWDGNLMESFPMQANIFVLALGEDCGNDGFETEILQVDLEKTFKTLSPTDIENTVFNVRDACSQQDFQCPKDCDETVSNDGFKAFLTINPELIT